MTTLDVINKYKEEYERANGKPVIITYWRGWFKINTDNFRRKEILSMIEVLKSRPTVTRRQEMVNGVLTWIEPHQHVVKNLLTQTDVIEDRDLPLCCSVASETYWSM